MEDNHEPNASERLDKRAKFVANFIDSNSRKGVKVTHSVKQLAYKVLFVSEKTIYTDLKKGKSDKHY